MLLALRAPAAPVAAARAARAWANALRKGADSNTPPRPRLRAAAAAAHFRPCSSALTAGIAGDYGEVCVEFLRVFDTSDMDPARLTPEISDLKKTLHAFVVEGRLLCAPTPRASTPRRKR